MVQQFEKCKGEIVRLTIFQTKNLVDVRLKQGDEQGCKGLTKELHAALLMPSDSEELCLHS